MLSFSWLYINCVTIIYTIVISKVFIWSP